MKRKSFINDPANGAFRERWGRSRNLIETLWNARRGMPGKKNGNGPIVNSLFAMAEVTALFRSAVRTICPLGSIDAKLRLDLTEKTVVSSKIRADLDGFKILHLSDIHFDGSRALVDRLSSCIKGVEVDLIAMTGDYRKETRGELQKPIIVDQLAEVLGCVSTRFGVVATLGNHDPSEMVERLEKIGVLALTNETVTLACGSQKLHITGLDDPSWHFTKAARRALRTIPSDSFGLALVHTPELAHDAAEQGYDLYLAGHTHGGQVRQFLRLIPPEHRGRASGEWNAGSMKGFTSNGVGTSTWPIRLGSPAEATILTLKAG